MCILLYYFTTLAYIHLSMVNYFNYVPSISILLFLDCSVLLSLQSGIENPMVTSRQVREGADSEQDDDDSGCAVFSVNFSSSDDGADSKNSSGNSDGGQSQRNIINTCVYIG